MFFSLRRAKERLGIVDDGDLSSEQAARLSEVFDLPAEVIAQMNQRMSGRDLSLQAPLNQDDESASYLDQLVDEGPDPEATLAAKEERIRLRCALRQSIEQLPERDRKILMDRRLKENPDTLQAIGSRLGISRERARQIEERAFSSLKTAMISNLAQSGIQLH
jgi:RNA polymerase sigma-32 factor